jgi:HlyD family secretion protein
MDHARPKSNAPRIKRIALMALFVAVLISGGVTLAQIDFDTQRVERGKLSIETVQQGTLEIKVSANGRLLPKSVEQIGAQVSGRVAKLHVKPGDAVSAGQLLVELTNPQLVASAEEAYSAWEGAVTELQAAEAELQTNLLNQEVVLTQSQFNLERAQLQLQAETKLIGEHIISDIDYQRSKLNVAQLKQTRDIEENRRRTIRDNIKVQLAVKKSRVAQLERALARAQNQAENLRIVAGIGGIVQAIGVDVGEQLQPGSPVGRVAQPEQLYAELRVPAREAGEVQVGQSVTIDTRSGTVAGAVTRVDPGVTDGTVIVDVDPLGELPAGARPHLQVEGVIYLSRLPNTLYVGKPAYVKTNAAIAVYKLDADGRYANRVAIKGGKLSLSYLQVLEGLKAGDRIITSEIGEWQDKERILID